MNSEQKAPLKMDADNMPKLLLSFALPATVGMLANAVYNIVDRIFVGRCSGPDGIAAITLGFPTMIVMFAFSLLFAIGGSSRVSILRGARKRRAAERALIHTIALLALAGFLDGIDEHLPPAEIQGLGHDRHHVGLGDRLPVADLQRAVFVRFGLEARRNKEVARNPGHGPDGRSGQCHAPVLFQPAR